MDDQYQTLCERVDEKLRIIGINTSDPQTRKLVRDMFVEIYEAGFTGSQTGPDYDWTVLRAVGNFYSRQAVSVGGSSGAKEQRVASPSGQ